MSNRPQKGRRVMQESSFDITAAILTGVFLSSGLAKLRDGADMTATLDALGLGGSVMTSIVSRTLPWSEIILAIGLLAPPSRPHAAIGLLLLLTLFTSVLLYAWARKLALSCGCFGFSRAGPVSLLAIGRNVILVLLSIHLVFSGPSSIERVGTQLPIVVASALVSVALARHIDLQTAVRRLT